MSSPMAVFKQFKHTQTHTCMSSPMAVFKQFKHTHKHTQVYGAPSSQTIAQSEAVDQLCEMGFERPAAAAAIRRLVEGSDFLFIRGMIDYIHKWISLIETSAV